MKKEKCLFSNYSVIIIYIFKFLLLVSRERQFLLVLWFIKSKRDDKRGKRLGEGWLHDWGWRATRPKETVVRNRCLFFLLISPYFGFRVDCELIFCDWCSVVSYNIWKKCFFCNFILHFYIFFLTIFRVKDHFFLRFTISKWES